MNKNVEKGKKHLQFGMCADVKMCREVDINVDYISPGGYGMIMNGKNIEFDFESYHVHVDKDDSSIIHIEAKIPDVNEFEGLMEITENHLEKVSQIIEFFIFTGEVGETDLRPIKLLTCKFNTESEEYIVSKKVCDYAKVCSNIQVGNEKVVNLRLYAASIIDTFEDFLEEKGISIDNEDKVDDDSEAIIYGSDFDNIMESILTPLEDLAIESRKAGAYNKDTYNETLDEYAIHFYVDAEKQ